MVGTGAVDVPRAACNGSVMLEQLREALRAEHGGSAPHTRRPAVGWESRGSLPGWQIPAPLKRRP